MIDKLTPKQESKMSEYVEKYIAIGLNTDRINKEQCKMDINDIQINILNKPATDVIVLDSPIQCWEAIRKHTDNPKLDYVNPYLQGSFDSYIFSYYDFMHVELGVEYEGELLNKYEMWKKTLNYGLIYPLEDICFVSEKPISIKQVDTKCHADLEPAIIYADGLKIFMLNGIKVPEWLVMTPKEKLDPNKFHEITNVEVRKEFVRKIGLINLLPSLNHKVIDTINADDLYRNKLIGSWIQQGDVILEPEIEIDLDYKDLKKSFRDNLKNIEYKLIDLEIINKNTGRYLYMTNASLLKEVHIEGVSNECKTVFEAICFRNKKESLPCLLT